MNCSHGSINGYIVYTSKNLKRATQTKDGLLSFEDKTKLNSLPVSGKSDAIDLDSSNMLATSKAVKLSYDRAVNAESNAKTYADSLITALIDGSEAALDTLNELSDALGNDPNFATTIINMIGTKANQTDLEIIQNEVLNSAPVGTVSLSNTTPVTSIDAKVNGGLNFEMEASPLIVNLLGRDGDCEDITKWIPYQSTRKLDTTNKAFGSNSIKVTITSGGFGLLNKDVKNLIDITKHYMLSAYIKNGDATGVSIGMEPIGATGSTVVRSDVISTTTFTRVAIKIKPTDFGTGATSILARILKVDGADGKTGYVDGAMLKEITAEEYALPDDVLMAKYPYVNGIQPMIGLNLKSRGENLVRNGNCEEGINHWVPTTNCIITIENGKFKIATTTNAGAGAYNFIDVKPNTDYYISGNIENGTSSTRYIYVWNTDNVLLKNGVGTFNTGANGGKIKIQIVAGSTSGMYAYFDHIQLKEGTSAPTEYKPYQGSESLIDGEFAGIGTYLDKLTYKNGIVKKLANVRKEMVDGALGCALNADGEGFKEILLYLPAVKAPLENCAIGIKYDAKILQQILTSDYLTLADVIRVRGTSNGIVITIADVESGFGETYFPSAAEIQACMNGWKMNNGVFGTPYNGTGTKTWTKWNATDNTGAVTICPTTKADGWTAWATLWYALATPEEEILDTLIDGLSVYQGKTTISLQTGIVKEKANPLRYSANYYINRILDINNPLSHKTNNIIKIIRVSADDSITDDTSNWSIGKDNAGYYGGAYALMPQAAYEVVDRIGSVYYVIYEVLHEEYDSQQVEIIGEYTKNLRDSHNELVKVISNAKNEIVDTKLKFKTHEVESAKKHITESGSNVNGSYIKFDDGTMICWHFKTDNIEISTANGSIFYGNIAWTFPATFIIAPNFVSITPTRASSIIWGSNTSGSVSTTGTNFYVISGISLTANYVDSRMFAIGRWK